MNSRKKQSICLIAALLMAALLTGGLMIQRGMLVQARAGEAKESLAGEVLRFHVLANSDSDRDQNLKMKVKEILLSYMKESMKEELPEKADLEMTKKWAEEHLEDLERISEETLEREGCDDEVKAELVKDYFPEKSYGDVTFPAGEYEALRIRIGNAMGHNWWCCLYPELCFTDAVHAVVPKEEKETLGKVLSEDAYDMITASSKYKIKWFFFGGASRED